MPQKSKNTIFQNLNNFFMGAGANPGNSTLPVSLPYLNTKSAPSDEVLFRTKDKNEYERKLTQMRQQRMLSYQWVKAGADIAMENLAGYTAVKLMYRDADLMDASEIGSALDIYSEEACVTRSDGRMLIIHSKSQRVKSILEDLFVNRLQIHTTLPAIARDMCKYGNEFMLLNIQEKNGVMGWRPLPVYEIDRIENGYTASYAAGTVPANTEDMSPDEVKFVWVGHNESQPFRNWNIAHFRLLYDSFFLPYGVSILHKARRAWRMWSMMEDAMLIYRLDKSIERRVYKIYVGAMNQNDVQAYVNDIANRFKRTPIIDPQTGQVDLRKNFLDVSSDYFIPVRNESAANPIETLASAKYETAMDDIQYMQNKIFAALRVPKTFLNFQEPQGKGSNLSLMDIRFARMVNRVQQFLIAELNKIAMIHLYMLGMTDELTNFSLSLNNPSAQIEALELDELTKRVGVATQLLADPGIGMPIYSLHKVLKDVMKLSDAEIKDMMGEIRLEKAMAAELANTPNIILKTGVFDSVDRIYGDYNAMNNPQQGGGAGGDMGGPGGGGGFGGGGDMGGGLGAELGGGLDAMGGGDMSGGGDMDMGSAPGADSGAGGAPLMEGKNSKLKPIKKQVKSFTERYLDMLNENIKKEDGEDVFDYDMETEKLNLQTESVLKKIESMIGNKPVEEEKEPSVDLGVKIKKGKKKQE